PSESQSAPRHGSCRAPRYSPPFPSEVDHTRSRCADNNEIPTLQTVASSADAQVVGRNDLSLEPEQRGRSGSAPTSRSALPEAGSDIIFPSFMDVFTHSGGAGCKTAFRHDPLLGWGVARSTVFALALAGGVALSVASPLVHATGPGATPSPSGRHQAR